MGRRVARTLVASAVVALVAAIVWGVLFAAFGTTEGEVGDLEAVVDHFDGADRSSLTEAGTADDDALEWTAASGEWGVVGGQAAVLVPGAQGSAALTQAGSPLVTVSARMTAAAAGWALVFRYAGPGDQWFVATPTAGAPLALFVVVDGRVEQVVSGTGAPPRPGDRVEVRSTADGIVVRTDGRTVIERSDTRFATAAGVGMALLGTDQQARWDDFTVQVDGFPIVTVPADATPGP